MGAIAGAARRALEGGAHCCLATCSIALTLNTESGCEETGLRRRSAPSSGHLDELPPADAGAFAPRSAPRPEKAKPQAPLVHEQHVALRAPRDRLVDRPAEQTLEKAVFAAADDDQIGVALVGHLE